VERRPGIPPSAAHVADLVGQMRRQEIAALWVADYYDDEIPQPVKVAVALLASSLRETDRSGEQGRDGVKRVKADVVEVELDPHYRIGMLTDDLTFVLRGLGVVNTGSSIGFGQIVRS